MFPLWKRVVALNYHFHIQSNMIRLNMDSLKITKLFLEHISSLLDYSLFLMKIYPFVEKIRRFNINASKSSPLFTNEKPKSTRNKTNLDRLDLNFMF